MKKFKLILYMMVILSFLFGITGCNSNSFDQYTSLIAGVANDGTGIETECEYWTGTYFEKAELKNTSRSVHCNNQQYTATYRNSITDNLNSYTTDVYYSTNNVEFGVHANTGNLVYINLMTKDFFDTEPYLDEVNDPEETALSVAREIAMEYVTDLDDYELIIEDPTVRYKEKDGQSYRIAYHTITYARKLDDYYTSDYISVKVTSKGNLASIRMGDIGIFSDTAMEFDKTKAKNSIDDKIYDTFSAAKHTILSSVVNDQKLVVTPDRQICLYSDVAVQIKDASQQSTDTRIAILTTIEEKNID